MAFVVRVVVERIKKKTGAFDFAKKLKMIKITIRQHFI